MDAATLDGHLPHVSDRRVKLVRVSPRHAEGRHVGYNLDLDVGGHFDRVTVSIGFDGRIVDPIYASSPAAEDGIFGGAGSQIKRTTLILLRDADANPRHPLNRRGMHIPAIARPRPSSPPSTSPSSPP
jgi:hypothetical protein